jgi:hypothetical protein
MEKLNDSLSPNLLFNSLIFQSISSEDITSCLEKRKSGGADFIVAPLEATDQVYFKILNVNC